MKPNIFLCFFLLMIVAGCNEEDSGVFNPSFGVYVLLPAEGLGDRSFVDVVYEGVETAVPDFNFRVEYVIPETLEKGEEWIRNIPNLKCDLGKGALVIIAGSQFADAVNGLDGNFGPHKVLLLAGSAAEKEGLASIDYRTYGASYIGGYMSAKLIPGCRAVAIAGFDASFLTEYQAGFAQGIVDAGGTIKPPIFISSGFEGFEMPDSAYNLTTNLLPSADLIFAMSAGSNLGIINAVRNYPARRYVIGIDADQSWMGLTVVTGSVIKLFGSDIYDYIKQFSKGEFAKGSFIRTLEDQKIAFLLNKYIFGETKISETLIKTAIEKENNYTE